MDLRNTTDAARCGRKASNMATYQDDRDEFMITLAQECMAERIDFGKLGAATGCYRVGELGRELMRRAQRLHGYAVAACNYSMTPGQEKRQEGIERRVVALVAAIGPGWRADTQRDPRGAVLKILMPSGRYNSWGGRECGYCVPTRAW